MLLRKYTRIILNYEMQLRQFCMDKEAIWKFGTTLYLQRASMLAFVLT